MLLDQGANSLGPVSWSVFFRYQYEGEISAGSASIWVQKSASSSSNIQIFTREGRHIAGTTLSGSEIASLLVMKMDFLLLLNTGRTI